MRLRRIAILVAAAAAVAFVARRVDPRVAHVIPVVINLALAALFASTLRAGAEPMIARFARRERGSLEPELRGYTRRLTVVWVAFFVAMAAIAAGLSLAGWTTAWLVFALVGNYALIAALLVGEYLYRRRRFAICATRRLSRCGGTPPRSCGSGARDHAAAGGLRSRRRPARRPRRARAARDHGVALRRRRGRARPAASAGRHALQRCERTSAFLVTTCAAWCAGRTVVMPPTRLDADRDALRERYPEAHELDDALEAALDGAAPHWPPPALPDDLVAAILFTSGSTRVPRESAKTWARAVPRCDDLRADLRHPSGPLQGSRARSARSTCSGWRPRRWRRCAPAARSTRCARCSRPTWPSSRAAARKAGAPPLCLATTPLHLEHFHRSPAAPPAVARVIASTMPLARELAVAVERDWGARVDEIYGSTECGMLGARRPAVEDAFTLGAGLSLDIDADGAATASGAQLDAPVALDDRLAWRDVARRRFSLEGRRTDMVKVAGKRTTLAALGDHLRAIDGVEDGAFFPSAAQPGRLCALVVAPSLDEAEVRRRLAERIDPAFLPRPLIRVERLPRDERGKLALTELQRLVGEGRAGRRRRAVRPDRARARRRGRPSVASRALPRPSDRSGRPAARPGRERPARARVARRRLHARQVRRAGDARPALRARRRAARPRRGRVHDEAARRRRGEREPAMRDGVEARDPALPRWRRQRERGSPALMAFIAGVALRIGRRAASLMLPPICAYFMVFSRHARRASRDYMTRALGRPATWRDMYGQFHCFATTILDRVLWLAGRTDEYDVAMRGVEALDDALAYGRGCLLVGAHYGSFELLRVLATTRPGLSVRALMHPHNDRKLAGVLDRGRPCIPTRSSSSAVPRRCSRCARRSRAAPRGAARGPHDARRRHGRVRVPRRAGALPARPVQAGGRARRAGRAVQRRVEGRAALRGRVRGVRRGARRRDRRRGRALCALAGGRLPPLARELVQLLRFLGAMTRLACAARRADRAPAHALTLDEIAATLRAVDASRARFVEIRTIAALGTPIERRGTLSYARPGRLEMNVESPVAERMTIADGRMTVESRGTTRVVDLTRQEPLLAWIEGIRSTLAGDEATLRRYFEPTVAGTLDRWTLALVPRDARLRSLVARVTIAGERDRVRTIEVDEVSGDRSVTTIVPLSGDAAR
jgi:hypothetical protein